MAFYIVVIVLFIAGMLWLRKYLLKRMSGVKSGTYMKIIDRLAISQDKQVILVEMRNKILVIGVSPQKIETLGEFSKDEFGPIDYGSGFDADIDKIDGGENTNNNFLIMLRDKLRGNFKDGGKK